MDLRIRFSGTWKVFIHCGQVTLVVRQSLIYTMFPPQNHIETINVEASGNAEVDGHGADHAKPIPCPHNRLGWLWPVLIGICVGSVFLAPFVSGPGDPSGHCIGAGLGGCLGLLLAIVWRIATGLDQWNCKNAPREQD